MDIPIQVLEETAKDALVLQSAAVLIRSWDVQYANEAWRQSDILYPTQKHCRR